jgi:hypothetical protein
VMGPFCLSSSVGSPSNRLLTFEMISVRRALSFSRTEPEPVSPLATSDQWCGGQHHLRCRHLSCEPEMGGVSRMP